MRLELHLLITGTQKGSKASSRGGKSEEACEIVSLVLQRHRDDIGEAEEISVEELLPEEEARKVTNTLCACAVVKFTQSSIPVKLGCTEEDISIRGYDIVCVPLPLQCSEGTSPWPKILAFPPA